MASFATAGGSTGGSVVSASPTGVARTAAVPQGWQGDFVYTVPSGTGGLFFHYPCPGGGTPDAGKFLVDFSDPSANSIHLIGEGLRTDVASHEWQWNLNWSGGVAPAGSHITFNVHCSKK
jgi:hypothetical protein